MVVAFNTVPAPFYASRVVTGAPYCRRPREVGKTFLPNAPEALPRSGEMNESPKLNRYLQFHQIPDSVWAHGTSVRFWFDRRGCGAIRVSQCVLSPSPQQANAVNSDFK